MRDGAAWSGGVVHEPETAVHLPLPAMHPEAFLTMSPDDAAYAALAASGALREYRQAFRGSTGLNVGLLPAHDASRIEELVCDDPDGQRFFCGVMARCLACLDEKCNVAATIGRDPVSFECFSGLRRMVVPVRADGRLVALLQSGPSLRHPVTPDELAAMARGALRRGAQRGDLPALETAYRQTPVLESERYDSAIRLLGVFAEHLGLIADRVQREATSVGMPPVERARRLIVDGHEGALSLDRVAQGVGLSPGYFSELFRRSTGSTFSDYLARARIDHAKALLRYPHLRVSEIAYRVGFQSLSQFNRTFRRLVGIAPRNFRSRQGPG